MSQSGTAKRSEATGPSQEEANSAQQPCVLIVDDTPANVKLLEAILKPTGYRTLIARDGQEALDQVDANDVDIILLDILMPKINGYDVCRRLRGSEATAGIPVIMITALQGLEEKVKGLEAGADDFITKPFQKVELLARVRSLLRVKNLRDKLSRANRDLAERNRMLEMEMKMARSVQQALLPQAPPMIPGFIFTHKYLPAALVGGDFFDIRRLGEKRAGILVSDVSGHGVRGALIMSIVKTLLDDLQDHAGNPASLLEHMNRRFRDILGQNAPLIFATALYMVVDASQHKLHVANAGHPCPIVLHRSRKHAEQLTDGQPPDTPLGFLPNPGYREWSAQLDHDDVILAFTDGLYEIFDEKGRELGEERLTRLIEAHAPEPLPQLVSAVVSKACAFGGKQPQHDDINVVAAQIIA